MKKLSLLILFGLPLFLIISCSKLGVEFDTTVKADIAVPLLESETTVKDMLVGLDSSTVLRFENDGQVIAQFSANAQSKTTLDPFNGIPSNFIPLLDTVSTIPFAPPGGLKILNADFKKGMTNFIVTNNYAEALTITFRIPQMTKGGIAFKKTFALAASAASIKDSLDLTGYSLTVTNDEIKVYYDAIKNTTKERVKLANVQFAFSNMQGKYVKGYFGVNRFDVPRDSINISFIEQLISGEVRFTEPKITLLMDNSYGIPVRTNVKTAEVLTTENKRMSLTGSFVSNGVNISYPSLTETGQFKTTQVVLDKTNSNVVDIISSKPKSLVYDIDGVINPDGNRNITGFFTDSSYFKMKVNFEIPIYGTIKNFVERDTVEFTFPSINEVDHVELKVIADNGTGLNAGLQAYFLDASNRIVDSLYSTATPQILLKASQVDAAGKVTAPTRQISYVKIDAAKLQRLQASKKAILKYTFSTVNDGTTPVRLMASQQIKVKLGAIVGVKNE